MNSQELTADLFRISLRDEKIRKDKTQCVDDASIVHYSAGKEVMNAIVFNLEFIKLDKRF
ncbi:MAG: hypothetical protein LBD61_03170 [Endomicrobium sp.]|jgi:hypothetical protein|nr:hypothetical protein [Endomicrobium sp.]